LYITSEEPSLTQFYNQVSSFGKGRVQVGREHPGEVKITHWFPAVFLLGLFSPVVLWLISKSFALAVLMLYVIYFVGIFVDSWRVNKSLPVALLSIPSAFVQLTGYGSGFLRQLFASGK
jgi:hypothetical protein